jgi:hypothetical protein
MSQMCRRPSFLNKWGYQIYQHLEDIRLQKSLALQQQSLAKATEAWLLVGLSLAS